MTTLRRQLQRTYLDTMIEMAITPGSGPEDAKMLAWNEIRTLKPRLEAAQKAVSPTTTRAFTSPIRSPKSTAL